MIPNPIHKVLSTFQSCGVRALLMGGQVCVFYGAAEFSRDTEIGPPRVTQDPTRPVLPGSPNKNKNAQMGADERR